MDTTVKIQATFILYRDVTENIYTRTLDLNEIARLNKINNGNFISSVNCCRGNR